VDVDDDEPPPVNGHPGRAEPKPVRSRGGTREPAAADLSPAGRRPWSRRPRHHPQLSPWRAPPRRRCRPQRTPAAAAARARAPLSGPGRPTRETRAPRWANSWACSIPTYPPPTTTRDSGSSASSIGGRHQPADVMEAGQLRAGRPRAGGHQVGAGAQRLPVDGQGGLVDEAGVAPADLEAVGVGDVSVLRMAQPRISSSFCPTRAPRSTPSALVGAPANGLATAACRAPAAANSVLDGTQPTFTHVPPSVPRSTSSTVAPACRAVIAAAIAAPPGPTTAKSTS